MTSSPDTPEVFTLNLTTSDRPTCSSGGTTHGRDKISDMASMHVHLTLYADGVSKGDWTLTNAPSSGLVHTPMPPLTIAENMFKVNNALKAVVGFDFR